MEPYQFCESCPHRFGCMVLVKKFDRFLEDEMSFEQYLMEEESFRKELFSE